MDKKIEFSPTFCTAFRQTWAAIAADAGELVGDDNLAAIELVIDADRLATFGCYQAQVELSLILREHGYEAVEKALDENFKLV